ncbi:MAG TPA: GGDEF domain-containing protein [Albitalea sp.]|uniref:GGDEF domain-containing protein n=1 Tax=Piscinibacter sp. TaxID=1903157 RepID=UPI002ED3F6A5
MNTRNLRPLLICLVAATAVALLWHRFGMDTTLEIGAHSPYHMQAVDDRSNGGRSVATLRRDGGKLVLDCEIRTGYDWPYCELGVTLKQAPAGIDLSGYDTMRLWVRYDAPQPGQQLRIFLTNFNPAYSQVDVEGSAKVVELQYAPGRAAWPLEVKLSQFTVASWWSNEHPIAVEHAGTELTNVTAVQVSTGGTVVPGAHRITVERIEFHGKLIPAATFRLLIIAAWVLAVFAFLLFDAVAARRALRASTRSQLSLRRVNEALRLQSQNYEALARRDPLTGILNRRGLGDELVRVAGRGDDSLFPLSLVFIDIDHFKRINDEHGHAVGDQVLREVAQVIKADIQRTDLFARWGGEEFLLICPHTEPHEVYRVAERLRQRIAERMWPGGIRLTSSFGVADSVAGEDFAEGIRRADEAMYRAKQGGRDRVELQLIGGDGQAAA